MCVECRIQNSKLMWCHAGEKRSDRETLASETTSELTRIYHLSRNTIRHNHSSHADMLLCMVYGLTSGVAGPLVGPGLCHPSWSSELMLNCSALFAAGWPVTGAEFVNCS